LPRGLGEGKIKKTLQLYKSKRNQFKISSPNPPQQGRAKSKSYSSLLNSAVVTFIRMNLVSILMEDYE
jgi:hypothetical protein